MRKVAFLETLGLWKAGTKLIRTGALFLLALWGGFCGALAVPEQNPPARGQQKKEELPRPLPPRTLQPIQPIPSSERPSYAIQPGDVLRVSVWKEPDLTGDVMVRPDGKITLPLLGDVEVAGRSPQQLSVELGERLRRFVEDPRVTVGVAQANSARFYIIGQVAKPGVYPLTGRISVIQALALAGGFLPFAKKDKVSIVRDINGVQTRIPINYEKLEKGKNLQQLNVLLQGGDTIVVP